MGSIALPETVQTHVSENYIHQPRPIRVIVIGAGISGIAWAYKALSLPGVSYTIYEKNPDVGGTWYESRYPGCSCDIPAHSYSYPWVSNPNWSKVYVGSEEIFDWYKSLAKEYKVYENTKFTHTVVGAQWNEEEAKWHVQIRDDNTGEVVEDSAEVLLNCAGVLNKWKWPAIPGLHDFEGTLAHTARYPQDLDLTDKRVAVIGAGSSAIQVVPTIQPIVKSLTSFTRSPTWIAPQFAGHLAADGRSTVYTDAEKERFATDKEYLLKYRKEIDHALNSRFPNFYKGSPEQKAAREMVEGEMRRRLANVEPALKEKLIPDFDIGCRRVTPGEGYLEALQMPNVNVVTSPIQEITKAGLLTQDGVLHPVDVIITATGYDTSYVPPFPLIGRNGVDLAARWQKTGAEAYLTCAVPDMPNYFMVVGPNTPISNGSLMPAIDAQLAFALHFIRRLQTQGVRSATVSQAATHEFNLHKDAVMDLLTFSGSCNSWYKGGTSNGRITGPWCGSVNHFLDSVREVRGEDFEWVYEPTGNRFSYLGRGLSKKDIEKKDLGWYITA